VWVADVAAAVVRSLHTREAIGQTYEAFGPETYTLGELVQRAGQWAGVRGGRGRPVLPLPRWVGWLQALAMELLPGEPLMSRDNLASMKVDNLPSGQLPGLSALGIRLPRLQAWPRATWATAGRAAGSMAGARGSPSPLNCGSKTRRSTGHTARGSVHGPRNGPDAPLRCGHCAAHGPPTNPAFASL